jgi:hypothetical protein
MLSGSVVSSSDVSTELRQPKTSKATPEAFASRISGWGGKITYLIGCENSVAAFEFV